MNSVLHSAQIFHGQALYAAVDDLHHLEDVIDPFTTALGMLIAGSKTPYMQGTLGFPTRPSFLH